MSGDKGDDGVSDTQDFLLRGVSREAKETRSNRGAGLRLKEGKPSGAPGEYERLLDIWDLLVDWDLEGMIHTEGQALRLSDATFSMAWKKLRSCSEQTDKAVRREVEQGTRQATGLKGQERVLIMISGQAARF